MRYDPSTWLLGATALFDATALLFAARFGTAAHSRAAALFRAAALLAATVLAGCDTTDNANRLATRCARESAEPRVQHLVSLLSDARVTVTADRVEVEAQVPVGIGIDARPKFHILRYACTRNGADLDFETFSVTRAQ